jgi:serine/threonine-protein kinase
VFHEGGHSYIAQEYIEGETLEDLVRRGGPVAEARAVHWGVELCEVLSMLHAHAAGPLIYRDLKPANVILRARDGRPVLVDFGTARPLAPGAVGTVIGTPGYAAPEQYQGLADPRTDVYALGATLHRLVTGYDPERAAPFRFPAACALNPGVSRALAAVLARTVQPDPAARYATARELGAALRALAARPVAPAAPARSSAAAPPQRPIHWDASPAPSPVAPATSARASAVVWVTTALALGIIVALYAVACMLALSHGVVLAVLDIFIVFIVINLAGSMIRWLLLRWDHEN